MKLAVPAEPTFRAHLVFCLLPWLYGRTSPRFSSPMNLEIALFWCSIAICLGCLWCYFSLTRSKDDVVQTSRVASVERQKMGAVEFAFRVLLLYAIYALLAMGALWLAVSIFSGAIAAVGEMLISALLIALLGAVGAFVLSFALDRHYRNHTQNS